jgi:hypothetical protein
MSSKSKTTRSKKATAPKAKARATSTAERTARVESWRAAYRLAHGKPMSLSPKMPDARIAVVFATWTPQHKKRVASLLSKAS